MQTQRVHLVFPNLQNLWSFAQEIHVTSMQIITGTKTLICDCKDLDIELAKEKYKARVENQTEKSTFTQQV